MAVELTFLLTPILQDQGLSVPSSYRPIGRNPLRLGNQVFPSEGPASPWDRDVDDTMSLLSVAFEHVPELDEERVAILGSSRVGAVALLAAVRDRRIDAGVEFFGPTDFFSEYAREISRRRSKASSAIFPVSSTSTRPSSGPVAHVPGSHGPGLSIRSPVLPPSVRDSRSRHRACLAHIEWEGGSR